MDKQNSENSDTWRHINGHGIKEYKIEYKITFKNFWKYLTRVIRHKWYVFKWCCRCGMPLRGLLHDLSKFHPVEFWESVKYFSDTESPINVSKRVNGYSKAWQHHKGHNPHHYEYWIDQLDYGGKPIQMPKKYAYEMICDYLGAGQAYNPKGWTFKKEWEWWLNRCATCEGMAMNEYTKQFVSMVLGVLGREKSEYYKNQYKRSLGVLLDVCWNSIEESKKYDKE